MKNNVRQVVILEFLDEAHAYVDKCRKLGSDPDANLIISLAPGINPFLQAQGIEFESSTRYFTNHSHFQALEKSQSILDWLESVVDLEDSLGIRDAYVSGFLWYCRFIWNHMLWISEILAEIKIQHPSIDTYSTGLKHYIAPSPMIRDDERFLGILTKDYCQIHGMNFVPLDLEKQSSSRASSRDGSWLLRTVRKFSYRLGSTLHRAALKRFGTRRPILALTRAYQMESLISRIRMVDKNVNCLVIGSGSGSMGGPKFLTRVFQTITARSGKTDKGLFEGEVWLQLLQRDMQEEPDFVLKLEKLIGAIADIGDIKSTSMFTYRQVPFHDIFVNKLRKGIQSAMLKMHREILAIEDLLTLLNPRLIITPFGRRELNAMGEISKRKGIPGILISHGSFTPMKNKLEEMAWRFHSYGLFHGSFEYAVWQTPLSEQFSQQIDSPCKFVKTGPLIWGLSNVQGKSSEQVSQLVTKDKDYKVVLHAGTTKPRHATHFHVYESADEYIEALKQLILAVDQLEDVFLIIKYRPTIMPTHEFRELLPKSEKYSISIDESFMDVLGISDLLVSFSSTTIEEALQNNVPVLLYGGGGRYQHVKGIPVLPNVEVDTGAVFVIDSPAYLADGLRKILKVDKTDVLRDNVFEKYVYDSDNIQEFDDLVKCVSK